jgi:hypothetical protein
MTTDHSVVQVPEIYSPERDGREREREIIGGSDWSGIRSKRRSGRRMESREGESEVGGERWRGC